MHDEDWYRWIHKTPATQPAIDLGEHSLLVQLAAATIIISTKDVLRCVAETKPIRQKARHMTYVYKK